MWSECIESEAKSDLTGEEVRVNGAEFQPRDSDKAGNAEKVTTEGRRGCLVDTVAL